MKKVIILTLAITFSFFINLNLNGDTYLNGSFESSIDIQRDSNNYKWEMYNPWNRIELRFWSSPLNKTEIYAKAYGDSWRTENNYERHDSFYLDEAHIGFKSGEKDNFITYLFIKECRFWLGDPLLNLVNNDYDKWDNKNVSGVVTSISGFFPGFYSKIFGAKLFNSKVNAYGIRIYKKILENHLSVGLTSTYKDWEGDKNNYNLVYASDIWFNIKKTYFTFEIGQSITPDILNYTQNNISYKGELRKTLNSFKLGELGIIASYRDYGKNFRAYLSKDFDNNRLFDQKGIYLETKYKVPHKAITITYHLDYWQKHFENYRIMDNYLELYIKFIKGFRFKSFYQRYSEYDWDKVTITDLNGNIEEVPLLDNVWQHFFAQLEMENKLVYVKLQFKIKNMFTDYLKYLYGVEYSINITDKLKSLNRFIIVDEVYRTRYTLFSQIQYKYSNNVDFYLGYGNESDSNDDLVNDDNFVESNRNIEHKIHLYIKASF